LLFTPTNPISKTKKTAEIAILVHSYTNRKIDKNNKNETWKPTLLLRYTDRKRDDNTRNGTGKPSLVCCKTDRKRDEKTKQEHGGWDVCKEILYTG